MDIQKYSAIYQDIKQLQPEDTLRLIMETDDEALNYSVELHFISVESVETAKQRIAYRVLHGGHGIPGALMVCCNFSHIPFCILIQYL